MKKIDLSHLIKKMDISLNSKYIYEHINPKYRKDIFDLHNELLAYNEGKEYKDIEAVQQLLEDWYNQYFKKAGGIKAKYIIKYTELEKWNLKLNNK